MQMGKACDGGRMFNEPQLREPWQHRAPGRVEPIPCGTDIALTAPGVGGSCRTFSAELRDS